MSEEKLNTTKEKSVIQKYGLVFFLSCIAVLMMMVKLAYKNKDWKAEIEAQKIALATPTPLPTVAPTPTEVILQKQDYALWQELPYSGKGFVVDRYIDGKTVVVQPKGLDKKIVKEEVWKWFEENQVATDEMKIKWE